MRRVEIFEALQGIWCVRDRRTKSCAYIVKTVPGAVVVDAGADPSAVHIMMGLQEARVGLSSVRALVLTHWHFDQAAGAAALSKRAGTTVLYCEPEAPFLTGERASFLDRVRGRIVSPVAAERFVRDGELVEGQLEILATPGHTEGHASCYLESHRALFTGDALTVRSGRLQLMDDNDLSRRSAHRCLEKDVEWVLPGHGSPLRDTAELAAMRSYLS